MSPNLSGSATRLPESASPRLPGAPNFRDLGGLAGRDNRRVRYGRVFRSDDLASLGEADFERLQPLGIRLICDLRGGLERERRPSLWHAGSAPEKLLASMSARHQAVGHGFNRELLEQYPGPEGARRMMLETYRTLPRNGARGLLAILNRIADGGTPALIHCTAGKDRTGFICAMLLHVLGVPREAIYADYLLTNERVDLDTMALRVGPIIEFMLGMPANAIARPALDVVNSVDADYLDALFAAIEAEYGAMESYFDAIGVDAALRARLQDELLDG